MTVPPAEERILADLNPAQREAVLHRGSPLLVVAGAGSGKTRAVTRRIAHLVASGEPPDSILAVTFTNKAAGEMRERVAALLGAAAPAWVSTFHSMAARMLRRADGGVARTRDFTIYDDDDGRKVVRGIINELRLDEKSFPPQVICSAIDRWKTDGLHPEDVTGNDYRDRALADAFRLYEERLKASNAMDFNDLLLHLIRLLEERPEVLEGYRRRFRNILVDEYQDTNAVQYRLVRLLAGDGKGLCAVGDPDQSIYGWRGARIGNILDFGKSFPGTRIVRLEENYRSTAPILSAAGAVIAHNAQRIERGLRAVRPGGSPVELVTALDEEHEAAEVARRIAAGVRKGRRYSDYAVFYRTNAQSRAFEEAFLQEGLPYAIVAGTAFYDRAEIKDALAWLRVAVNPADEVSFLRAVGQPPRGVGDSALEALRLEAARRHITPMAAAQSPEAQSTLTARARAGLAGFAAAVAAVGGADAHPVEEAVRRAVVDTGLRKRFETSAEAERVENLDELVAAAGEYDAANPDGTLSGFIEQVALVADIDGWDEKAERVSLMTLHAAKGLEFPAVFLTGLEESLLPHGRALSESGNSAVEEERRLLYVGMTRAREELVLSWARARRRGGPGNRPSAPSRFISELPAAEIQPPGAVEAARAGAMAQAAAIAADDDWDAPVRRTKWSSKGRGESPRPDADGRYFDEEAAIAAAREEEMGLGVGDLVEHERFGRGRVEAVEGFGPEAKITVTFSKYGRKKLVAGFARLKKAGK